MAVPLADRVQDLQQPGHALVVLLRRRCLELRQQPWQQRLPLGREVVRGDQRHGLGELALQQLGHREVELQQVVLDLR